MNRLADNLKRVQERVGDASLRSGRRPDEVRIVAVSKFHSTDEIDAVFQAGQADFGENYPQELWAKAAELSNRQVRWHFTGHLQRNKIDKTIALTNLVHSVDSPRLLEALNVCGIKAGRSITILLQINISGESSKQGFSPDHLPPLGERLSGLAGINVQGLMTIAEMTQPPQCSRRHFEGLRILRDRLQREWGPPFFLQHLIHGDESRFRVRHSGRGHYRSDWD